MPQTAETLRVPCSLRSVHGVRRSVRSLCERDGLAAETTDDLILAVNEAATNAIRYGCPDGGEVQIRWQFDGDCVEVLISDSGVFRKAIPMPGVDDTHGRGIPLMIALVDELHIREGSPKRPGTVVRLVKCSSR
jgi:anti-sigma regulatory factor (Ser/Thr protein kinase)